MPTVFNKEYPPFEVPDYRTQQKLLAERKKAAADMVSEAQKRIDLANKGEMIGPYWVRGDDRGDLLKSGVGSALGYFNDKEEQTQGQQLQDIRSELLRRMPSSQTTQEKAMPPGIAGPGEAEQVRNPDYANQMQRWGAQAAQVPGLEDAGKASLRAAIESQFREPKGQEGFTLGEGQKRYGPDGREIASGPAKPVAAPTIKQRALPNDKVQDQAFVNGKWEDIGAPYSRFAKQVAPAAGSGAAAKPAKPLPPYMAKDVQELFGNQQTLSRLESGFKDEYAGDLRSSIERGFGQLAGGAAPQSTQDMTRWWADQAFFDELPQRHALFGAALTPTEQKSWANAAINPSLSPKVIRERLATRKQIYDEALARKRDEIEAAGQNVKQFDAMTGNRGASGSFDKPSPTRNKKYNPATGRLE